MPKQVFCRCASHGCDGLGVDPRTAQKHKEQDLRAALLKSAKENSDQVIQKEISTLASHLDDIHLSTEHQPPIWGTVHPRSAPNPSPGPASSQHKHLRILLARLSTIDENVDTLLTEFKPCEGLGSSLDFLNADSFSLHGLLVKAHGLQTELDKVHSNAHSVQHMKTDIQDKLSPMLEQLRSLKSAWVSHKKSGNPITPSETPLYLTDRYYLDVLPDIEPIAQVCHFLVTTLHVLCGTSRDQSSFILIVLIYIVQLCFMHGSSSSSSLSLRQLKVLSDTPTDSRSVDNKFDLESNATIYAVCPNHACEYTHAPRFKEGSPIPEYPRRCRNYRNGSRCGQQLLRPRTIGNAVIYSPIKPFVYHSPKEWLGRILSRTGLEEQMDNAWKKKGRSPKAKRRSKDPLAQSELDLEEMDDIFDGDVLKNFRGPDGKPFGNNEEEGRYVFSLCIDWYNPLTVKAAGKSRSFGIIALVCLNVPPHLRYKPEYMFLAGIIPGPRETAYDSINHFLRPVVNDFLQLWTPGVFFSRTSRYPLGRLIRCAVVCCICDLLAARKLGGFGAPNHNHFCPNCQCTRKQNGYGDFNKTSWGKRTIVDTRRHAKRYRKLFHSDYKGAQEILKQTGMRGSELIRLPYFDPSRFVVVDPMHNLFLGLINEHFDGILGIRGAPLSKPEYALDLKVDLTPECLAGNVKAKASLKKMVGWFRHALCQELSSESATAEWINKLSKENKPAIISLCEQLGVQPILSHREKNQPARSDYAKGLVQWRKAQTEVDTDPDGHRASGSVCGHILTKKEIEQVRDDIKHTIRPSWLTSVPANLGEASHGKLKADQWRALGTVFLPLSLIHMWSAPPASGDLERRQRILHVTMNLICAVIIATSRVTSGEHANAYHDYITKYHLGVKMLFPDYAFSANNHVSLHIDEFLRLYGPTHSWWTFPFERVIGTLQRFSSNFKEGQYEETVSRSFVRFSNLRRIFYNKGTPTAIKNCEAMFDKIVKPQVRDTLVTDSLSYEADDNDFGVVPDYIVSHTIPADLRKATLKHFSNMEPADVLKGFSPLPCATVGGLRFSPSSAHLGNASALIDLDSEGGDPVPARIDYIFQLVFDDGENSIVTTYIAARRYLDVSIADDPYTAFKCLNARLWGTQTGPLEIYELDCIRSHFASLPIVWNKRRVLAVISLSREL